MTLTPAPTPAPTPALSHTLSLNVTVPKDLSSTFDSLAQSAQWSGDSAALLCAVTSVASNANAGNNTDDSPEAAQPPCPPPLHATPNYARYP